MPYFLLRCAIYIHFYDINLITQGVITPNLASGATIYSKVQQLEYEAAST